MDETVHAIILDIKMPGKDGFQVYKEIRAAFPDIPIIFFSAYQNVLEAAKLSQEYKPFTYFDKNGDIHGLLDAIQRAVAHYAGLQKLHRIEQQLRGNV